MRPLSGARIVLLAATLLAACCGSTGSPGNAVDCGSFDAGHGRYDARGVECFWNSYSAGTAASWSVKKLTIEGDPIPQTMRFEPGSGFTVTRDITADKFSAPQDRRVWTWRCSTITRKPWATDPSHTFFELCGCSGDGPTTAFP